ncbi:UDP-glucose 6-dehydrogenase [Flavobacteriaceae bacterium UJ101]|nr:UDP-glucose 6-dehydrogenase [Flavobacteriaceae bacterium UJ101]
MKVAVVGSGYVGLVTGVCLAEVGHHVIGVDIDSKKVEQLQNGVSPIFEKDIEDYLIRNSKAGRIKFTTSLQEALEVCEVIFLALPTPPGEDGSADLSYVLSVAEQIGDFIQDYKVIINKSTVPVGTAAKVTKVIEDKTSIPFDVVSNPEFLREGLAIQDFMNPERIVVGASSEKAIRILRELYKPFITTKNSFLVMDEVSAELTKYAANSFLAMKITYMNELANLCERTGANVDFIKEGLGSDSRISSKFLNPGIGVGGSCFPKDMRALIQIAEDYDYDFRIMKSVREVNDDQKVILVPKILKHFNHDIKNKKLAVWGLSFKPDTDDIREASSLYTIKALLKEGAEIIAFDPVAMDNVKNVLGDQIQYAHSPIDALKDADGLIICTEWRKFKSVSLSEIKKHLKEAVIFDGRNIFELENVEKEAFSYYSIGR